MVNHVCARRAHSLIHQNLEQPTIQQQFKIYREIKFKHCLTKNIHAWYCLMMTGNCVNNMQEKRFGNDIRNKRTSSKISRVPGLQSWCPHEYLNNTNGFVNLKAAKQKGNNDLGKVPDCWYKMSCLNQRDLGQKQRVLPEATSFWAEETGIIRGN